MAKHRAAGGETWVNPRAYAPPPPAPREYVQRVVNALVREHRVRRQDAERIVAQTQSRPSVDDFYERIHTGWGQPEDPSLAARIIAARAGAWEPPSAAEFHEEVRRGYEPPEPAVSPARIEEMVAAGVDPRFVGELAYGAPPPAPYAPPPQTPYRTKTIEEMVRLGMHPSLAADVADFLEIDGPRTGAHRTPKQAARWGIKMQRRIAAAGGV